MARLWVLRISAALGKAAFSLLLCSLPDSLLLELWVSFVIVVVFFFSHLCSQNRQLEDVSLFEKQPCRTRINSFLVKILKSTLEKWSLNTLQAVKGPGEA